MVREFKEDDSKELREDEIEEERSITIEKPGQETLDDFKKVLVRQEDTRAFLAKSLV